MGAQPNVKSIRRSRWQPPADSSFRVLSDVARLLVSEADLHRLLESIADALAGLVPYDSLTIYGSPGFSVGS